MRMDNLCNEGPHGSLHQLGDRLRKSLRAVGVKSGDDREDYTDVRGNVRGHVFHLRSGLLYSYYCCFILSTD